MLGLADGELDGAATGDLVGAGGVGDVEGAFELGLLDGAVLGALLGCNVDGERVGCFEGDPLGDDVGEFEGLPVIVQTTQSLQAPPFTAQVSNVDCINPQSSNASNALTLNDVAALQ